MSFMTAIDAIRPGMQLEAVVNTIKSDTPT